MTPALWGAAVAAALAAFLALTPNLVPPRSRSAQGLSPPWTAPAPQSRWGTGEVPIGLPGRGLARGPGPPPRGPQAAALLAAVAAWLLLGGALGLLVGATLAVGVPFAVARMEPAAVRRQRLDLTRSAPLVADLLGASLLAGVPLEHAVPVVARAVGGASEHALRGVHQRTELGEASHLAWAHLSTAPGLGGIARAVARSTRTGAPLAGMLVQAGDELRAQATALALAEVRATSVRAVLPLGLFLLPAFALLGVAPIVGGLLPSL